MLEKIEGTPAAARAFQVQGMCGKFLPYKKLVIAAR